MGTTDLFVEEAAPHLENGPRPIKDDDEISINSSIASQHDSDEEFTVEGILYQIREDGKDLYLVEWTGYPIEEATWEPEENVLGEVLEEWRAKQEKQARREEEIFDIFAWQDLVDKRDADRRQRHHDRNVERKRRGLEISLWDGESREEYESGSEDVSRDDYNAIFPPPKPTGRQKDEDPSVVNQSKQSLRYAAGEKPNPPRKPGSVEERPKSPTKRKLSVPLPQNRPQQTSIASNATGYQGTARKPATNQISSNPTAGRVTSASASTQPIRKAKKTQLGARKMVKSVQTGGNVFTSGKPIRTHLRLAETMVDATKDPRMFTNHRIRRKAELQGRDRADKAPANLPTTLFSISSGPPPAPGPNASAILPRSVLKRPVDDLAMASTSESGVTTLERAESNVSISSGQQTPARPTAKKRKSVQWAADIPFVEEPESMEMEVDGQPSGRPKRLRSPPQPEGEPHPIPPKSSSQYREQRRKMSITQYHRRTTGQDVEKRILMGPAGTMNVLVKFENVRHESEQWHLIFSEQQDLQFGRNVQARTFSQQRGIVVERVLSHGNIRAKSPSDEGTINNAAERLRLGSFGAAYLHEHFTIIIYPTGCEDWKGIVVEADAASPANAALKYFIFKPSQVAMTPLPERTVAAPKPRNPRASILQRLLRLDYHKLTPPGLRDVRHNFYLAFPPSRETMLDTLSEWLHAENPYCKVFSTKTSGDWTAFTDPNIVSHGVVIVHEAGTDALRGFPNLLKLLLHKNSSAYLFWCIGESLQQHPMYPSIHSMHDVTEPGTFELTRLFTHGNAVLVTPSFLIAEPYRAFRLFEWHSKNHRRPTNNTKIVAAADIRNFLRNLALDKAEQRRTLLAQDDNPQQSNSIQEDLACKAKLSHQDCTTRFDTWTIVDSLLRPDGLGSIVSDEQPEPIIFADECIDANDEQSLVNWFGCWSQTRLDQFRKFHVLGTDMGTEVCHVIKYQDLPVYAPGTELDVAVESHEKTGVPDTKPQVRTAVDEVLPMGSQKLGTSNFYAIKNFLFDLAKVSPRPGGDHYGKLAPAIAKLFAVPVGYSEDMEEAADSMGDFRREFATYKKWLDFPWPFFAKIRPEQIPPGIPDKSPRLFSTYLAFFYTPQSYVPSEKKWRGRHPWLAVYRPKFPNQRPWKETELLIWDVSAKDRFPTGKEIHMSQLLPAQQHLIRYVEQHGEKKNPGLPLTRVWLGGFHTIPPDYLPLDATLEVLEGITNDLQRYLPAMDYHLLERGYRPVSLRDQSETPVKSAGAMNLDPTEGLHGGKDDLSSTIIFHPPRNPKMTQPSRCENMLYKWVKDVARRDPTRSASSYTFKPTMEWYNKQMAENRHYEHVHVGPWQRVFDILRIPAEDEKTSKK